MKNTLSDNGGVTRGICKVTDGHTHLSDVVETGNIVKKVSADGYIGAEADGVALDSESYISMNMWGFPAKEGRFRHLWKYWKKNSEHSLNRLFQKIHRRKNTYFQH